MPNEREIGDPRKKKKWRNSGSVETIREAALRKGLPITTLSSDYKAKQWYSIVGLGSRQLNPDQNNTVSQGRVPIIVFEVPGCKYRIGKVMRKLPRGARLVE